MLVFLKKTVYVLIILAVNLYICEYISNKLLARAELRRGYRITRVKSAGFPMVRLLKYMSKDNTLSLWTYFTFLFSFLIWITVPITSNLILVEMDFSLLTAVSFYIGLIIMLFLDLCSTSYNEVFSNVGKRLLILLSFIGPCLLSIASIIIITKTLNLKEIINSQHQYWNIIFQPLGFITLFTSSLLQLKLLGISGKNYLSDSVKIGREGTGLVKIIQRVSAYMIIFFLIILMSILYLGGWQNLYFIRGEIMIVVKFYFIYIILLLLDKATSSIDSYRLLVKINWGFLLPLSLVNLVVTFGFSIVRNYNLF
jgi:NADH-quinone oxidoreductase subunit H